MDEELQWILKLRDEASAQWKSYRDTAAKANKEVADSAAAAGGSIDRHGKSVQGLSNWIKEQRGEQRQHNFLFQQGREVIGATAVALTALSAAGIGASGDLKKVSDAANAGFVAFQGFNNVLGFLPDPIGIAVSLVAGLGIAFAKTTDNTEAAKRSLETYNQTIKDFILGVGPEQLKQEKADIEQQVKSAEVRKQQAEANRAYLITKYENTKAWWAEKAAVDARVVSESQFIEARKAQLGVIQQMLNAEAQTAAVKQREKGSREEELRAELNQLVLMSFRLKVVEQDWLDLVKTSATYRKATAGVSNEMRDLITIMSIVPVPLKAIKTELTDLEVWQNFTDAALESANIINTLVGPSIGMAMEAAFTGAEDVGGHFLRQILNGFITLAEGILLTASAAAAGKSIFTFGVSLAADLAEIAAGYAVLEYARAAVNRSFHTGGSAFINAPASQEAFIKVRGQEDVVVRTPEQRQAGGQAGNTFIFNFNSPVPSADWVVDQVKEKLRQTGLTVDKLLVSHRAGLAVSF